MQSTHPALFVQKGNDAQFAFNQINTGLVVVVLNKPPLDLLPHVLVLLELEHMLGKLLLELFVCVVDAKLLETTWRRSKSNYEHKGLNHKNEESQRQAT